MATAMVQQSPRFWDKIAPKYSRQPIADEDAYQRKLDITQRYMTPEMHALELGCGTGGTARLHAPCVARYTATDYSEGMIRIAQDRAKADGQPGLTFRQLSVFDALSETETPDMVIALSVFHLLPEWKQNLRDVYRALPPGGLFVSSTACLGDMAWYIRMILRPGKALGFFPHVSVFTGDMLRAELRAAGFELVEDWRPAPDTALFLVARKPG